MADDTNSEITVENKTSADSSQNAIPDTSTETMTTEAFVIPETYGGDNISPTAKSPTTSVTTVSINLTPTRTSIIKTVSAPETSIQPPEEASSLMTQPLQPASQVSSSSKSEKSRRSSEVVSRCPVCHNEAVKKKNTAGVLKCSTCSNFVHFPCSSLPAYMLYSLSNSNKKYVCEVCTATPEPFLTNIVTNICNTTEKKNESTPIPAPLDNRYDVLENKVNSLSVILEKFDLQALAENLTRLGNKLETTSNNVTATMKEAKQLKKEQPETVPIQHDGIQFQQFQEELNRVKKDLDFSQKELSASRSSNELLMKEVSDRDATLTTVRDRFEKNIEKHGEKVKIIATLEAANKQLRDVNTAMNTERAAAVPRWSTRVEALQHEKEGLSVQVNQMNERIVDFESKHDQLMEVNSLLKGQLTEASELNKSLQTSFSRLSTRRNVRSSESSNGGESGDGDDEVDDGDNDEEEEATGRDEVVILHDSMCKRINPTLLSREKVKVKKVWAPDMNKMEEALERVDSNVVVLEAWTRDLERMDVNDINQRIIDIVSKALTKAEKVVITTIINRTDVKDIGLKVNAVNSFIKLKYMRHESVVVCDNYKLDDNKFRVRDNLHLNDDGVPIFASNLKYAIAKAAGVRVIQKRQHGYNYDQGYERNNQHRRDNSRRSRWSRW